MIYCIKIILRFIQVLHGLRRCMVDVQFVYLYLQPGSFNFISPFEFHGIPTTGPRKKSEKGRKSKNCIITTDTPKKNLLLEVARKETPA